VPCGVYQVVRRLARDAGLPHPERVHPHALRHTAVTLALDAGAQGVDVQDMAGHSDPRTTRRYDRARGGGRTRSATRASSGSPMRSSPMATSSTWVTPHDRYTRAETA